jgi:hypothetical protein
LEKCKIWGEQVSCSGEAPSKTQAKEQVSCSREFPSSKNYQSKQTNSRILGDPSDLECIDDEDIPFLNDAYYKRTPFTPKRRCYLLGTAAMNIPQVAKTAINITKAKNITKTNSKEEEILNESNAIGIIFNDPPNSFRLKHNFNPTYCVCEILPLQSMKDCECLEFEINKLESGAKSYAFEEAIAIENGRSPGLN